MTKRKINVDVALKDIRSGMSDAELMGKYRLSSRGLQSLFKKLVAAGLIDLDELDQRMPTFMGTVFITHEFKVKDLKWDDVTGGIPSDRQPSPPIALEDVVKDIRSGASDATLMSKYNLSAAGLQSLLEHLVFSSLMTRMEADERTSSLDSTIDVHGLKGRRREVSDTAGERVSGPQVWECPACGRPQPHEVDECPICGVIVAKLKKRMAMEL